MKSQIPTLEKKPQRVKVIPLQDIRPCDLVLVPGTARLVCLRDLDLEKRRVKLKGGFLEDEKYEEIEGVFEPETGVMLFDRDSWMNHLLEQRAWDARIAEEKRAAKAKAKSKARRARDDEDDEDDSEHEAA